MWSLVSLCVCGWCPLQYSLHLLSTFAKKNWTHLPSLLLSPTTNKNKTHRKAGSKTSHTYWSLQPLSSSIRHLHQMDQGLEWFPLLRKPPSDSFPFLILTLGFTFWERKILLNIGLGLSEAYDSHVTSYMYVKYKKPKNDTSNSISNYSRTTWLFPPPFRFTPPLILYKLCSHALGESGSLLDRRLNSEER